MKKIIAAAAVAASVAIGGIAGVALGVPTAAGAHEKATGTVSWVEEALSELVGDGTITQAQADAVETALEEAKPKRPHPGHRVARHFAMDAVAEALGITNTELRQALSEDKTIAEIADDKGVPLQTVVDAIVAKHKAHLDEHVAAGDITEQEADERLAKFTQRVSAFVDGDRPFKG